MLYKEIVKKVSVPANSKIKQRDYLEKGAIAIVDQGQDLVGGYCDDPEKVIKCNLPVIVFGDHTRCVKYVDFPFCAGADGIKILAPRNDCNARYLYYLTKYVAYKITNRGYARHYQQVEKYDVFMPSSEEQEKIVFYLEEVFSELDKGVETLQTIKQQLTVYRQAVLKKAFENYEKWDKYVFSDLMEEVRNGYGRKPNDKGKYRILKISAVRPLKLNLAENRYNQNPFSSEDTIVENDILFTRYNGSKEFVGVCAVVPHLDEPYAYPDKLIRCRPKIKSIVHSKFLVFYMNQGKARQYIRSKIKTTSGQNGISGADIKKTVVYLPDMHIQANIVEKIETRLSVCDSIEQTVDKALTQAEAMRQSILKKAFEGKL